MPRLTRLNPSYRKHRPSGQAVVTLRGVDFYLGPWKSKASQSKYDRLIGEWMASGRQTPRASDLTVAEVIERFWIYAKAYYRRRDGTPSGEADSFKPPLSILNRLYGETPAASFDQVALEACRQVMIDAGHCRIYINAQIFRLKKTFRWAAVKKLVPSSVHQDLMTIKSLKMGELAVRESAPVLPIADDIVDATLPHLSNVVAAILQLQRLTGARPGEICSMRIGDVDRTGDVWSYKPRTHKTAHKGKTRTISIGPRAQEIIKPFLLKLDPDAFVFSPAAAMKEMRQRRFEERKTPLSCGNRPGSNVKKNPKREPGDCYTVNAYRRAIKRACDEADEWAKAGLVIGNNERIIPRWNPHRLRHSAATEINKLFGIEAVRVVLGHSHVKMAELYAERNEAAARKVAAAIG